MVGKPKSTRNFVFINRIRTFTKIDFSEHFFSTDLTEFGLTTGEISGLLGIITMPFLHGDFTHLAANSVPMPILGTLLYYFYNKVATTVLFWVWLASGAWLWFLGIHGVTHIGASGIVYGLASFLFFMGIIRREYRSMVISLLVVFIYGSIFWGIFPIYKGISWEGHLYGAIAGVAAAIYFRKEGPPKIVYEWENESDDEPPLPDQPADEITNQENNPEK